MIEATPVTEKQIIMPLELVLNEVSPKVQPEVLKTEDNQKTIKKSLDQLFPEQQYNDKDIQKVKEILGLLSNEFSVPELRDIVAETQFLISSWLDDFERGIFDGKTLNELLHEKGGL